MIDAANTTTTDYSIPPKVEPTPENTPAKKEGWTIPPIPEKVKILVNLFTYDMHTHADSAMYITGLYAGMHDHPRLGEIRCSVSRGYPTDVVRNKVLKDAIDNKYDYVLFLDNDMKYDSRLGLDKDAKPFMRSSLDFALQYDADHKSPVVVGAPYCGGPPDQRVMVMRWKDEVPDSYGGQGKALRSFPREEAALKIGIEEVAALPTGCLLIDTRVTQMIPPPWFYYEYADEPYNTKLASTEDITFTRNLSWFGIPQFCNWNSWAAHHKLYVADKPVIINSDDVPKHIWIAAQLNKVPDKYKIPVKPAQ